jgi:glutamyl-Q tRNA(Asp) synthetase
MHDAGRYVGRFAPSPTGPLHAGSLVAALASWLDARANGGRWLLRFEDVDTPRCLPGAAEMISSQLAACGLVPDDTPWFQSQRGSAYQSALDQLQAAGHTYPCACSRKDIQTFWLSHGVEAPRHAEWVYPGTCRGGLRGLQPRAVRLRCGTPEDPVILKWTDRRLGAQVQNISAEVGDFVLRRADGLWAYQLAVVVDDAAQGITHVVRGEDLADNTARQIHLQQQLGLPTPHYMHTPLVLDAAGEKLSKSSAAPPLLPGMTALQEALRVLGRHIQANTIGELLDKAVQECRLEFAPPCH